MSENHLDLNITTDDDRLQVVIKKYWQLSESRKFAYKVSDLSNEYGCTDKEFRNLVKNHSTAFSDKFSCAECGCPREFASRTDYLENSKDSEWKSWTCPRCVEIKLEEEAAEVQRKEELRYKILDDEYQDKVSQDYSIEDLCFDQAIYLLSVIRVGASEDLSYITPHQFYESSLSPSNDYDLDILKHLYHAHLLCVHPGSRSEAIEITQDENPSYRFYPLLVHWLLGVPEGKRTSAFISELETTLSGSEWPPDWKEESQDLRFKVALEESLQYLRYVMDEHGFDFTAGDKTIQIVRSLLERFSVAQIYNFCWRAAKDAAAFYMRGGVNKQHAMNTVPGSIQRMSEKAIVEGWTVKGFGRNYKIPQSMVSQILHNVALHIGDDGFNEPIS